MNAKNAMTSARNERLSQLKAYSMNLVFHSSIPTAQKVWNSIQRSANSCFAFAQSIQGNRVVLAIASIAAVVFIFISSIYLLKTYINSFSVSSGFSGSGHLFKSHLSSLNAQRQSIPLKSLSVNISGSNDKLLPLSFKSIDDSSEPPSISSERLEEISLTNVLDSFENAFFNKKQGYLNVYHDLISQSIVSLSRFLDHNDQNEEEVTKCFVQIDKLLFNNFFNKSLKGKLNLMIHEGEKSRLKPLQGLFSILEKHISIIQNKDPKLAARLKIKFANLPIKFGNEADKDGRFHFPGLFLSETDQLTILIDHFKSKENTKIDKIINVLDQIRQKDLSKIAKMAAVESSRLSKINQFKLQNALDKLMGIHAPSNWSQQCDVYKSLENHLKFCDLVKNGKIIDKLWRTSKAKQFFEKQLGRTEDEIQIPRWYHATKHNQDINFFDPIIAGGKVEVMHNGTFRGAWVSNRREASYGDSVLAFSHRIAKIDPTAHIRTNNPSGVRWRGMQKAIPFISQTPSSPREQYLSLVGLSSGKDRKDIKVQLIKDLENITILDPVVISVAQVDYIQKNIFKAVGCPNLSEKWWGEYPF